MDRPAGPRLTRMRLWLLGGAILVVAAWGLPTLYRVVMEPWSVGWNTLVGTWSGSLRAKQGAEYGLYLDLEYRGRRKGRGGGRTNLTGRAVLCTRLGQRFEYTVTGSVSRSGHIESLRLEYGDPSLSALDFRMTGAWRPGALTLTVPPRDNPFLPDGRFVRSRTVSSDDPDDSFAPATLTTRDRAAFEAICQRIRR